MGVVAGDLTPDEGTLEIAGRRIEVFDPVVSRDAGVSVVYQRPALLPDLTVEENILLALPRAKTPPAPTRDQWLRERLAFWDSNIDPKARLGDISLAEQHLVEIVKALAIDPKVLILDEPTEHMDAPQVARLFDRVRTLTRDNRTVIYISHRIHEVKAIADRVTVLRDGGARGTFDAKTVDQGQIVNLIVGRTLTTAFPPKAEKIDRSAPAVLAVDDLSGPGFTGVSLELRPGEIIGLAGIEGNGQREFLRALAGLHAGNGRIVAGGKPVRPGDAGSAHAAGVLYIPRDRHREALMPLSVGENIGLAALARFATAGFMRVRQERAAIEREVTALSIKTPSLATPVLSLSGGNQQKSVIARALLDQPIVLLADEPSQGVDAGARLEIYRILRSAANEGKAIVVASSDALELQGLCDRILIFSRGRVIKEIEGADVTEHNITTAALTSTSLRDHAAHDGPGLFERLGRSDYVPSLVLVPPSSRSAPSRRYSNPYYLTGANFGNMLTLLTALAFVSMGQLIVMLTGGIDLSVGPLTGFAVVVASFFVLDDASGGMILLGFVLAFLVAVAVGLANAFLIRVTLITPVIATLATYMGLRGAVALLARNPDGLFNIGRHRRDQHADRLRAGRFHRRRGARHRHGDRGPADALGAVAPRRRLERGQCPQGRHGGRVHDLLGLCGLFALRLPRRRSC